MSDLFMTIGEDLPVLVDYDYQPAESGDQETPPVHEGVTINAVFVGDADIKDMIKQGYIDYIAQAVFDSFDEELQEPERDDEYID